jgi:RimJ/RimL family protein N-acetyltransferase
MTLCTAFRRGLAPFMGWNGPFGRKVPDLEQPESEGAAERTGMERDTGLAWQGAKEPVRRVLEGRLVRLEPLAPERHGPGLFAASNGPGADPALWDYMSEGPFADQGAFASWLERCARSTDPLFLAVVDKASRRPGGMVSFMRITPAHGVIEIGNIWFGAELQRTAQATETIFLLCREVFESLSYRRLEWKCNALNERSRRAAQRFGFTFEGIFRQHMVIKGRNRDTAWFAMLDRDWPDIRAAFEQWLKPDNFDEAGRQRRGLAELRARRGAAAAGGGEA